MEIQMSNKIFFYSIFFLLLLFPKVALSNYYDSAALAKTQCESDEATLSNGAGISSTRCNNSSSDRKYTLEFKSNEVGREQGKWYVSKIYEYLVDNSTDKYSTEDEAKKACNSHWSNNPNNITYSCDKKSDDTSKYFIHDYSKETKISSCIHTYRYGETEDAVPVVTINNPVHNSVGFSDENISISASATDDEDGDMDGKIQWYIDGSYWLTVSEGDYSFSAGTYKLEARVTDLGDNSAKDSSTLIVKDPPVLTISAPISNKLLLIKGVEVEFTAKAIFEDVDKSSSFEWSVTGDASTGTGSTFKYSPASNGLRTIVATITFHEREFTKEISVRVVDPPELKFLTPVLNQTLLMGEKISLDATATFDGKDITADITWEGADLVSHALGHAVINPTTPGSRRVGIRISEDKLYDVTVYYDYEVSDDEVDENLSDDDSCKGQMFVGDINLMVNFR